MKIQIPIFAFNLAWLLLVKWKLWVSAGLLLNAQIVDIANIPELFEGWRGVTFINILKYYLRWDILIFWEGVSVKIWSLGMVIFCLSLVP